MSKSTSTQDRQRLQREALQVATELGWRHVTAKGDLLILRR